MPKRQSIRKYNSEEVQGEASWVKIRSMTWGQSKDYSRRVNEARAAQNGAGEGDEAVSPEVLAMSEEMIITHVFDWNWVDDEGKDLPIPKDDPTVVQQMTTEEIKFISECLKGDDGARKKLLRN